MAYVEGFFLLQVTGIFFNFVQIKLKFSQAELFGSLKQFTDKTTGILHISKIPPYPAKIVLSEDSRASIATDSIFPV